MEEPRQPWAPLTLSDAWARVFSINCRGTSTLTRAPSCAGFSEEGDVQELIRGAMLMDLQQLSGGNAGKRMRPGQQDVH